jgi:hypothetical protein
VTAAPEISVVIPLPDDRGHLLDCLKGFTQQEMDVPYEVIVAATEENFLSWIGDKKCKISVRGTLILRSIWEEIGGFLPGYGHFSEMMIGAKLESMGVRFGYAGLIV